MDKHLATTVFQNGIVITMDAANSNAEAVAIRDDEIIAVGTEAAIAELIDEQTKVVDLQGKTLIPGFYDGHSHCFGAGRTSLFLVDLNSPPIGRMLSIADYIAALQKKARETAPERWLQGRGYDDSLVSEKRHPTKADLDRVSSQHPMFIVHITGHFGVANSKALEIAGITRDTIAPTGGVIRKDPITDEPNGVLEETAMGLVRSHIPPLTKEQIAEAIIHGGTIYAKSGVTTANEGSSNTLSRLSDYQEAVASGRMPIRTVIWFSRNDAEAAHRLPLETKMITLGGVKAFQDGSIQGYTGYLSKPYHIPLGGDPAYRGYPRRQREELIEIVKKAHNAGLQVMIHGNGDAAIDDILVAFREAQKDNPRPDPRHVAIHAQMAREDQLDEMLELGVIPSFYVLHTYYWGDRHRDVFMGPERAFRMSPCQSAAKRGMRFTLHCDTPVVPQTPLLLIWSAVNRVSTGGSEIGSEQRVSPVDALRACTINCAYQNFEENAKGSIEGGKLADLVVLSDNPLTCDLMAIKDIQVLETIVGGKTVYKLEE